MEALRDLTERIQQELEGDADPEKLSSIADELGAAGDSFASTITKADEALNGGDEGGDEEQQEAEEVGGEGAESAERGSEEEGVESTGRAAPSYARG